jgi:dihydroorotate dehydrogenase
MAEIIKELKIDFITTINSVPHCSIIDIEREEFVIKNKFGGLDV